MDNWIYENTADNKSRFLLGEKGDKTLICIGINPSTAEPNRLDNTLATVRRFAYSLGYNSWLMLNVYPQRATDPNNLHLEPDLTLHEQNLQAIQSIFQSGKFDIWAAWGTLIKKRKYLKSCLADIYKITEKHHIRWYSMGKKTKDGHPHHPLYLKKDLLLESFEMLDYIKTL